MLECEWTMRRPSEIVIDKGTCHVLFAYDRYRLVHELDGGRAPNGGVCTARPACRNISTIVRLRYACFRKAACSPGC
jgi:hypothetical protein